MSARNLSILTRILVLAAFYLVGGIVGTEVLFQDGTISLVWPPAGIALGAILLFGYRYWPGVALGTLLFAVVNGMPLGLFTLSTILGNVIGAIVCFYLLERFVRFQNAMERVHDVAGFVLMACLLGTTVNAASNAVSLVHSGTLAWNELFGSMMHWWAANAMAVLVISPFMLAWGTPSRIQWDPRRMIEALACLACLVAGTLISFNSWYVYGIQNYPLAFLPYPFLVWAALRFGQRGATTSTLLVSSIAIYDLLRDRGPFFTGSDEESVLLIGSYIGVLAVTNLLLAAISCERGRAERSVRESERQLRAVVADQTELIWRFTPDGCLTFVNNACCRFLGKASADLLGRNPLRLFTPDERPILALDFAALPTDNPVASYDCKILSPDGRVTWHACTTRRLFDANNRTLEFQTVARDITERRQLEEQLRQSQKMEAIGQLAGGVAHDFNNLLIVIKGYATLLLAQGKFDAKTSESMRKILSSAERAAKLTRQLLMFSRKEPMRFQILDLNHVLADMDKMLHRLIGEHLTLDFDYCPGEPLFRGDTMMLEQVILNLTLNARDAMPDGGRIHLSTSIVNVDTPNTSRYPEARPGSFVRLQVSDTGSGIQSDILPRIFEPFFTTKEKGQGSGLGLATVFGIVKQHLGWIEVDTELNRGTTFSILLPISKAEPPSTFAPDTGAIVHHGSETVLLVEDEASLREALRNMLEWYGYQVLDAATGAQALRLWKSHRERIHLLLADIVLPDGFSGTELAAQLLADKPGLRIIYSTGYTDTVGKEVPKGPGIRFLPKPYLPQALAQTVRECLDEAAEPAR